MPSSRTSSPLTRDAALEHQLLGAAARGEAGARQDLLQAFFHGADLTSLGSRARRPSVAVGSSGSSASAAASAQAPRLGRPRPPRRPRRRGPRRLARRGAAPSSNSGICSPSGSERPDLHGQRRLDRPLQAGDVDLLAEHLGELLDLRQLLEVLEAEVQQELLGRAVEHRPAHDLLAAGDADQALLEQRLDDAARLHAAQLDDLGQRHRLLVGDHGERLEGLDREAGRRARVEQLAHPVVVLGPGRDLVAARDLDDLQPALVARVVGAQRLELALPVLARHALQDARDLARR